MSLMEAIMLWELNNPNKGYLDGIPIHAFIDREALLDFIVMECGDLRTVDSNSGYFHERVKTFFAIHKWNIDKLCDSLEFDYEPLNNYHGVEDRTLARDVEQNTVTDRDQTDDTVTDRGQTVDTTTDRDQTDKTVTDRNQTDDTTTDRVVKETEKTERDVSTVENVSKNQTVKDDTTTDRGWSESGSGNEEDIHFVSAFNDKESLEQVGVDQFGNPIWKMNDTEHDRDTKTNSYRKSGTEDINVLENKTTTETDKTDGTVDEDIDRTKDIDEDVSVNDKLVENIVEDDTLTEDIIVNEKLKEDINVKDVLAEDIHKNDVTDEDVVEHKKKSGNYGQSYQSLIEEERKQAQFNIYKWILNHWFHELMVSVW